ncbi:MAG: hypothetical protein KDE31_30960, partial [Caldilineaceae bacterium]|nr:hypothetical protein [Caldilineaceae bacterium]
MVIGFDTLQATVLAELDASMTACDLYGQCTTCEITGQCTTFVTEPIRYARTLAIEDVSLAEGDGGTTAFAFTVRLHGAVAGGLTMDYTTADGSATAPDDYTATNGTLTFSGVDGETQTITVQVNGDTVAEANESFSVLLSNLQGSEPNIRIGDDTGVGTIENDDQDAAGSSLTIDDVSQVEGDSGTTAFV